MVESSRTALVAGATGLIGGHVVSSLLGDPEYSHVTALVRRVTGRLHDNLTERVVDFDQLMPPSADINARSGSIGTPQLMPPLADINGLRHSGGAIGTPQLDAADDAFNVTDVYACLGTTIKVAGSKERFHQVDHDYTMTVAKLAKAQGAKRFALVSSIGASAKAGSFYLRVKGETEDDIRAIGFERLVIAQPSILIGDRVESRPGEKFGIAVMRGLEFAMFGALRKYRAIEASGVALGMIRAMCDGEGESMLRYDDFTSPGAHE